MGMEETSGAKKIFENDQHHDRKMSTSCGEVRNRKGKVKVKGKGKGKGKGHPITCQEGTEGGVEE